MPIEGLIEKETSLKGRYYRKPCQNSYRCKKNNSHSVVICFRKNLHKVPQSSMLYLWPHSLGDLKNAKYIQVEILAEKLLKAEKGKMASLTNIRPHPVGKKARQQTIMSLKDS